MSDPNNRASLIVGVFHCFKLCPIEFSSFCKCANDGLLSGFFRKIYVKLEPHLVNEIWVDHSDLRLKLLQLFLSAHEFMLFLDETVNPSCFHLALIDDFPHMSVLLS